MSDYLIHHGVKGMKWGVRQEKKYGERASKWAGREDKARTRFGKNLAGDLKLVNRYNAETLHAINNTKSLKGKLQQYAGAEAGARRKSRMSESQRMKAERSRTRLGKHLHSRAAYNWDSGAQHDRRTAEVSKSTRARFKYTMKNSMKIPMKTITGKQSTRGKEYAKYVAYNVGLTAARWYVQGLTEKNDY